MKTLIIDDIQLVKAMHQVIESFDDDQLVKLANHLLDGHYKAIDEHKFIITNTNLSPENFK